MQRHRTTNNPPPRRPDGSWLAGILIGTTIMTLATQAMVLGAGAAISDATLKKGR